MAIRFGLLQKPHYSLFFIVFVTFFSQMLLQRTLEFLTYQTSLVEIAAISILGLSLGALTLGRVKRYSLHISLVGLVFFLVFAYFKNNLFMIFAVAIYFMGIGNLTHFLLYSFPSNKFYLYDLLGGGVGLITAYWGIPFFGGEQAILFIISLILLFILFSIVYKFTLRVLIFCAFIFFNGYSVQKPIFNFADFGHPIAYPFEDRNPYRNLSRGIRNEKITLGVSKWSMIERVDVGYLDGNDPSLFFNNRIYSRIYQGQSEFVSNEYIYELAKGPMVIIGVGGGIQMVDARARNSNYPVYGFEISPETYEIMKNFDKRDGRNVYQNVFNVDGRFVDKYFSKNSVGMIYYARTGLSSGFKNKFLDGDARIYSRESLYKAFQLLMPEGFLYFPLVWTDDTSHMISHRIFMTLKKIFSDSGQDIFSHMAIFKGADNVFNNRANYHLAVFKSELKGGKLENLKSFYKDEKKGKIIFPQPSTEDDQVLQKMIFHDLEPVTELTDDNPYFGIAQQKFEGAKMIATRSIPIIILILLISIIHFLTLFRENRSKSNFQFTRQIALLQTAFLQGFMYSLLLVVGLHQATKFIELPNKAYLLVNLGLLVGGVTINGLLMTKKYKIPNYFFSSGIVLGITFLFSIIFEKIFLIFDNLAKSSNQLASAIFFCFLFVGILNGWLFPNLISHSEKVISRKFIYGLNGLGLALGVLLAKISSLIFGYDSLYFLGLLSFMGYCVCLIAMRKKNYEQTTV